MATRTTYKGLPQFTPAPSATGGDFLYDLIVAIGDRLPAGGLYSGGSAGATLEPDYNDGSQQIWLQDENLTLNTPVNMVAGDTMLLLIQSEAFTLTVDSGYKVTVEAGGSYDEIVFGLDGATTNMIKIFFDGNYHIITAVSRYM